MYHVCWAACPRGNQSGATPRHCGFLRGLYDSRPTQSWCCEIWDVRTMLDYLRQLCALADLPLKELTLNLVMHIALVCANWSQSLYLLDTKNMTLADRHATFSLEEVLKHSKSTTKSDHLTLSQQPPATTDIHCRQPKAAV